MNTPALLEAASVAGILSDFQPKAHTTTPVIREMASVAGTLGEV